MEGGDRSVSTSIENRIVGMQFNNSTFQKAAAETLATLEKVKSAMDFKSVGTAVSGLPVGHISKFGSSIERLAHPIHNVSAAFIGLTTVAVTALSRMTNSAITAGAEFAKQFSGVSAAKAGFDEYSLTLNATQTMMAGTGESVKQVTRTLKELNEYSDTTIYAFRDMTENISKFTNVGLSSKEAAAAIKGVANVAAASGASANEAARSMWNFGQAMASGVVKLIDWKSIEIANMGTNEFKQQLIDSAVAMGTLTKTGDGLYKTLSGVTVTTKLFSTTLAEGWLTADALNATLARYSDNSTEIGKKAERLAQQVKTLPQALSIIQETMGSGWSETFRIVIGDLEEASEVWTSFNETVGGGFERLAARRNKLLEGWDELGGRKVLIEGLVNVFEALKSVILPIHEAFRDIFPPTTADELFKLTKMFRDFTEGLIVSEETGENIKRTFRGLFAVISIVGRIFKNIIRYVFDFFGLFSGGTGGVLEFTGSIGDLLYAFDQWIRKGWYIRKFFNMLMDARRAVLEPIIDVIGAIFRAFAALITSGPEAFFDRLAEAGNLFDKAMSAIKGSVSDSFQAIGDFFDGVLDRLGWLGTGIKGVFMLLAGAVLMVLNVFDGAGDAIADFFNFGGAGDAAASGTRDAVSEVGSQLESVVALTKSVKNGLGDIFSAFVEFGGFFGKMFDGFGSGFSEVLQAIGAKLRDFIVDLDFQDVLRLINTGIAFGFYRIFKNFGDSFNQIGKSASGVLDQVRNNLKTMQNDVRANMILKIAGAIALLAASIFVLSKIDPADLGVALGAVTALLGAMVGAILILQKNLTSGFFAGIGAGAQIAEIATGMVAMATAIAIMAAAVALFGNMDLKTILKGLGSVALVMAAMVGMTVVLSRTGGGATMIAASVAMTILAAALVALAGAVLLYDSIDASTLADGLASIAITIAVLVFAMNAMPRAGMIRAAAALTIIAGALTIMGAALKIIASLSAGDSFQAIATLGAVLFILVAAVTAMEFAQTGAIAMITVAGALLIMAHAMDILGSMKWQETLLALGAIAGLLIIFGVAGVVLAPIVPVIAALGAAMLLFGAGLLAAGAGMALFSAGLAVLATVGTAGFAVILAGIEGFLSLLPLFVEQFGLAIYEALRVITELAPELGKALIALLEEGFRVIIETAPELGDAFIVLVKEGLRVLRQTVPDISRTALYLLTELAWNIANNTQELTDALIAAFVAMLKAVRAKDNKVADQIVKTVISLANAISAAIENNSDRFNDAGERLAKAIVSGIVSFFWSTSGLGYITNQLGSVIDKAVSLAGGNSGGSGGAATPANPDNWEEFNGGAIGGTGGKNDRGGASGGSGGKTPRQKAALDEANRTILELNRIALTAPDISPTITPVLDLSQVERDASRIGQFLTADTSYLEALSVAAEREAQAEISPEEKSPETRDIVVNQNNYSPKALSNVEIYRGTKNAVAIAREELNA